MYEFTFDDYFCNARCHFMALWMCCIEFLASDYAMIERLPYCKLVDSTLSVFDLLVLWSNRGSATHSPYHARERGENNLRLWTSKRTPLHYGVIVYSLNFAATLNAPLFCLDASLDCLGLPFSSSSIPALYSKCVDTWKQQFSESTNRLREIGCI